MPTDKQKAGIEALFEKDKKKAGKYRPYGLSEKELREQGGIAYLSDMELAEVKERLEHGGYNHIA